MKASPQRRLARYLLVAGVIWAAYLATATTLWLTRDWTGAGPLSYHSPALVEPLDGGMPLATVTSTCERTSPLEEFGDYTRLKIVGGTVRGAGYYACYGVQDDGSPSGAVILDARDLTNITDVGLIKAGGAWPWVGTVTSLLSVVLAAIAIPVLAGLYLLYYRRARPGPPVGGSWTARRPADVLVGLIPVLGWIALAAVPGRSPSRKLRVAFEIVFEVVAVLLFGFAGQLSGPTDALSAVVIGLVVSTAGWGWLGGRTLRPAGWGAPDGSSGVAMATADPIPSWTAEQRRAADLEACGLVGEQFGLGAVLGVEHVLAGTRYKAIARPCSVVGGLTVLGSFVLLFIYYNSSWLWAVFLAGILAGTAVAVVGAILIEVHRSRAEVIARWALYDGGMARLTASSPEPFVVEWDDLGSVSVSLAEETDPDFTYKTIVTPDIERCSVQSRQGTVVSAPEGLAELAARVAYRASAQRIAGAMTAAYDAGEAVTAGKVHVDAAAITLAGGARLEWRSIRGVTLAHARPSPASPGVLEWSSTRGVTLVHSSPASPGVPTLVTITAPDPSDRKGRVTTFRHDPSGIPNAIFLADVIAHAARQHHLPVYHQAT
jgi:hypothetical protein